MVSVIVHNGKPLTGLLELVGKSTDEKPTESLDGYLIMNGSTFMEMDTSEVYMYDADGKLWYKL